MIQIKKYLALVLLSMTVVACDKEKEVQNDIAIARQETGPTKLFTASAGVAAYSFVEEDDLRAQILSDGYKKPRLNVTKEEFKKYSIPINYGLLGNGQDVILSSTTRVLDTKPSENLAESAFFIDETTPRSLINMYCNVADSFKPEGTFAFLALDGKLSNNKLVYNEASGTSPNALITGLVATEAIKIVDDVTGEIMGRDAQPGIDEGRHLPLITDIQAFDEVYHPAKKEQVVYKSRGSLIGLCIINQLNEEIILENVTFEADNALFFEGAFDCFKTMDGEDYRNVNSETKTESKPLLFEGQNANKTFTFPIKQDDGAKIPSKEGQTVNQELKNSLPLYYVWGFPRQAKQTLKLRLHLLKGKHKVIFDTKVLNVPIPQGGFKEGYAYRLPIKLTKDMLKTYHTPLDYLAEFAVNKAGNGFVKNYDLPTVKQPDELPDEAVGYYTWAAARDLFANANFLKDYYFPTTGQWTSIIPFDNIRDYTYYRIGKPHTGEIDYGHSYTAEEIEGLCDKIKQNVQIGGEPIIEENAAFISMEWDDESICTYAIRFIGTKWVSAWEYSRDQDGYVIIKAFPLQNQAIDFKDSKALVKIMNPKFFIGNPCSVRKIAFYGEYQAYLNLSGVEIRFVNNRVTYWGSSKLPQSLDPNLWRPDRGDCYVVFNYTTAHTGFKFFHSDDDRNPILPFYKKLKPLN